MYYPVHDKAADAIKKINDVKVDLSSYEDVITLDDKPLNLKPLVEKIKSLITETTESLNNTSNIED